MYLFIIIFIIINYLAAVGYADILRLNTDRLLNTFAFTTLIIIVVVFFSCPSIMEKWIIGVVIFETFVFLLYIKGCLEYIKNEKDKFTQN